MEWSEASSVVLKGLCGHQSSPVCSEGTLNGLDGNQTALFATGGDVLSALFQYFLSLVVTTKSALKQYGHLQQGGSGHESE